MMSPDAPDAASLFKLGHYFTASRAFLSAVELGLFDLLSSPKTSLQIQQSLDLHPNQRTVRDFLDVLVALEVITRTGNGESAVYGNSASCAAYLCTSSALYRGGWFCFCSKALYAQWAGLTKVLKEGAQKKDHVWDAVWKEDEGARSFMDCMKGTVDVHTQFAQRFDFTGVKRMLDVGGGNGQLACEVVRKHNNVKAITLDVDSISSFADEYIAQMALQESVEVLRADMFDVQFPQSDLVTLCNVLHCIDEERKKIILGKAYKSLKEGGRLVAIGFVVDDDRRQNIAAMLMSLHMAIVTDGGFDYSAKEFECWATEVGFRRTEVVHLLAPVHGLVAYK
eukprot:TRINITY_DN72502_c0_g1_i1.p1 TRINITY_DN72502_c0_g1~~TRINITY_DN72502_c0_g1_i1.p1  ORF type:complete len:338 (+),score=56.25 TRINITY_DN72502_c0_g1_i1:668-1681(+)